MNRAKIICLAFCAILLPVKASIDERSVSGSREKMPPRDTDWAELEPQLARLNPEMFFSCGRNALYIFLRLSGHTKLSFDEVKAAVSLSAPYGTTMKDLREAAEKLSFDAEVRLYKSDDFDSVSLPAIVHLSNFPAASAHFDVMYKRDSEWVYLINGTTGEHHKVHRKRFSSTRDWWTGWALTKKPSGFEFITNQWPILAAGFLITDIVLVGIWFRKSRRSKTPA